MGKSRVRAAMLDKIVHCYFIAMSKNESRETKKKNVTWYIAGGSGDHIFEAAQSLHICPALSDLSGIPDR